MEELGENINKNIVFNIFGGIVIVLQLWGTESLY